MPPLDSEEFRWFIEHVQPHEAMLRAWLRSRFRSACDVDDIVQEAIMRVLKAHELGSIESPKAFLFATARNLALMQLRHRNVERADSSTETDVSCILDENADVPGAVARTQELEILTQAIQSLPTRCRQIVTLRKIYGMSQRDIAARLAISEHTVEAQGTIGLRKLAKFFESYERRTP